MTSADRQKVKEARDQAVREREHKALLSDTLAAAAHTRARRSAGAMARGRARWVRCPVHNYAVAVADGHLAGRCDLCSEEAADAMRVYRPAA